MIILIIVREGKKSISTLFLCCYLCLLLYPSIISTQIKCTPLTHELSGYKLDVLHLFHVQHSLNYTSYYYNVSSPKLKRYLWKMHIPEGIR